MMTLGHLFVLQGDARSGRTSSGATPSGTRPASALPGRDTNTGRRGGVMLGSTVDTYSASVSGGFMDEFSTIST